ncbi:MAG: Abi family protein [bacterium]|jgi:hypothetical protein
MEIREFRFYFSDYRVKRYLEATANSNTKSINLYKLNLKVSQAFHPLLGVLEVVIRNRIYAVLSLHFKDDDWIINQKNGFMSDSSLRFKHKRTGQIITNDFLKKEVEKAESRILKSKNEISSGKIIAEQSLGFWTDLFEVHNYKLLKGKPIQIFKYLPTGYGRKEVNEEFNKIRRFRNRINHNEPICFIGNNIDFSNTIKVYKSIINLLNWISPDLIAFISNIDKVESLVSQSEEL